MRPALARLLPTAVIAAGGFLLELAIWDGTSALRWGGGATPPVLIAVSVVGLVAAVLTWVRPRSAFLTTAATSLLVGLAVPAWESFAGVLIALFVLARLESAQIAWAGLAVAALPLSVHTWNSAGWSGPVSASRLLPVLALWLTLAAATWVAGRVLRRAAVRVQALERSLREAEHAARIAERRAIARDLHDIVAHSVAGILLQAGGARALSATGRLATGRPATGSTEARVSTALGRIEDSAHQALRELHRLLTAMRTSDAADDAPEGERLVGLADLDGLVEHTRASGVHVEVRHTGEPRELDRSIDLAAYRCVQEALANAMKHAGVGSRMLVTIGWGTDLVLDMVSVPAPDASRTPLGRRVPGGLGLVGLSERLASVGGTLQAHPEWSGFRTVARIPVRG